MFLLTGCGKVVQQVSEDKDDVPVFSLSFSVEATILEEEPESVDVKESIEPTTSIQLKIMMENKTKGFLITDKLYSVLKGYNNNTVKNIAYSTIKTEKEIVIETIVSPNASAMINPNEKSVEPKKNEIKKTVEIEKTVYIPTSYDVEKIKIKTAKRTQFEVDFKEEDSAYYLKTVNVEKLYDYYLMAIYKNADEYKMKVINNKVVSDNKSITVETLTEYDTFKALLFIEAQRTLDITPDFYNAINEVFSKDMFNSLYYVFPEMVSREIKKKKPIFKFADPIIERCVEILELLIIDKGEIIYELENKESVLFSNVQIENLINHINKFELTSEEY